ncbi:DNA topoisomerase III [Erysipelatoclostridium sp. An15]|uniref:DNA topoisomerase III n=1 Tax=Erysipelatoclostridium sp. An15 TaxID=1965566 RepID=UPI000B377404|nr:DNA topoisomerase III [Erysipelatoclostridium sp. An15]OUQ07408.1 DNA topoisomerase III [Erysipelatoclostridium sp. An15]
MTKTLVLAEKPSVGKDIARVLQCHKNINGGLEGNKYIVTWALGHLVTLADPEMYDHKYQKWNLDDLPIMPERMKLVVIKNTAKQFNAIKNLLNRNDIKDIIIATDAGREGELVARWIINKAHVKKPMKRLWISSVTDKAIKDGFKNLKNARDYEPLYQSGYSRSVADWLVGINATRALTCKYNAQLACGRVQTPTLAMIDKRETEIKNFQPKNYYGIEILSNNIYWSWLSNKNEKHIFNQNKIDNIIEQLQNSKLKITNITTNNKKSYAPLLYDLTELQRDANKIYGFSAKETLSIMQSLYEYHKVLTYPRTDSRYLTEDIVPTLKERLIASKGGYFDDVIDQILANPIKKQNHFVNNKKVSDHHAIIPTEQPVMLGAFSDSEFKIYDLVLKRFLAVLLPPYIYKKTTIKAKVNQETFTTSGKIEIQSGWQQIYNHDNTEQFEQVLPLMKENDQYVVSEIKKTCDQTTPPAYFNEATLLSAMENPVHYTNNKSKQLNSTLINTGGLGTVATRADIIDKLFNTFLIEKRNNEIHVTNKGKQLLQLVPQDLKEPELTAKWELQLAKIAKKQQKPDQFINEIRQYTKKIINEINSSQATFKHDNLTTKKCPECNHFMLEVNGKKGKLLVCSNPDCKHKETVSIITNARCPNCHKKLELVGKKEKQLFVCKTCGYRQSMNAFKKERATKDNEARKSDIKKYLQQQKKQQTNIEDSPFAALLNIKDELK